jgi:hypothetical protein
LDCTSALAALTTQLALRSATAFRQIAESGIQAAEALEHAHQLGIVHRDIKPANLLIDGRGALWITDFGLARTAADAGLTMTGDILGTLRYMSPEQSLAKHGLVDYRTDVYSLGVTLYELLTGTPAVGGKDREEILNAIMLDEPQAPRTLEAAIPLDLETIVLKAIEKDPHDRYATAQELADELRRYLEDTPLRTSRPTLWRRAAKWARRHKAVLRAFSLGLALAVIALTASTLLVWRSYQAEVNQRQLADARLRDAREQRRQARRAVDTMYLEVAQNWLDRQPQMGELQKRFLEKVLGYYQAFAAEEPEDEEARFDKATAYLRVGRLLIFSLARADQARAPLQEATGTGVTIYNTGSNYPNAGGNFGGITLSGNGSFSLSAAASAAKGAYPGIVIFQAHANTRAVSLGGNAASGITGTIYAPAAQLIVTGNGQVNGALDVNELTLRGNGVSTQVADGTGGSSIDSASYGTLLAGNLEVYVSDPGRYFTANEQARIQDAINAWDSLLAPYNVVITEVSDPTLANVVIDTGTTSAAGTAAAGVLGSYSSTGEITILQGWSWYDGADPSQIGANQYDFQTVVTHELGHALGLGGSTDTNSPMNETLPAGTARRTATVADLNIPEAPVGADRLTAVGFRFAPEDGSLASGSAGDTRGETVKNLAATAFVYSASPGIAMSSSPAPRIVVPVSNLSPVFSQVNAGLGQTVGFQINTRVAAPSSPEGIVGPQGASAATLPSSRVFDLLFRERLGGRIVGDNTCWDQTFGGSSCMSRSAMPERENQPPSDIADVLLGSNGWDASQADLPVGAEERRELLALRAHSRIALEALAFALVAAYGLNPAEANKRRAGVRLQYDLV